MSPARVLPILTLVVVVAAPARGQVSEQRVRAAIEDATRGIGQAIAGGSPLAGPSAATGGLGHFALGAGATLTLAEIEDPTRSEGTVEFGLPTAALGVAVGVSGGTSSDGGLGGLGALDLIGRAGVVVAREDLDENAPLYALGARLGLLREGAALPSITVSAYRTWIDDLAWSGSADEPSFAGDVRALSLRADVSKSLLLVTPYAGVGIDRTSIDAEYRIPASSSTGGQEIEGTFESESTHTKAYAGLGLGLLLLDAAVEVGTGEGGVFGAVGVRVAH